MATITPINGKFRALVRLKGHKPLSKYCATREEAAAWAARVERELRQGARLQRGEALTVAAAIVIFRKERADAGIPVAPESNPHYMLEHLSDDLGPEPIAALVPLRLKQWAQERARQGAGAYTVNMELSQLGTVLRAVASILNVQLPDVVGQARPLLHQFQLIGGGRRRTRRPEGDELDRVLEWFATHRPHQRDAVLAAALSGLRRGEVCRVLRSDLDDKRKTVLVRSRKHPRRKERRDEVVPLFGDAWSLFKGQPAVEGDDRVFPLHPQTLTKSFTDCCRELGIPDLHLHDLRREANNRLREVAGFDREERKAVLGHLSDTAHEHYMAIRPADLHAKFDKAVRRKK